MSKPLIKSEQIKELQDLLESGLGVNEVQRQTGISKAVVGSVSRHERVYCHVCKMAHEGDKDYANGQCPTTEERAAARDKAKEDARPSHVTVPSSLVTDNTIGGGTVVRFQGGAGS